MKNNWESIEEVIVVLNDESGKEANEFIREIDLLGKKTKVLILSDEKGESLNKQSDVVLLTKKDFNLFGAAKSKQAQSIFNVDFDMLIVIDSFEGKSKKRMQKVKAKMKTGLNLKEPDTFFDINMSTTSKSIKHLINFVKEIVEKTQ